MDFRPSGKGAFTILILSFRTVNGAFPGGLKAILPLENFCPPTSVLPFKQKCWPYSIWIQPGFRSLEEIAILFCTRIFQRKLPNIFGQEEISATQIFNFQLERVHIFPATNRV